MRRLLSSVLAVGLFAAVAAGPYSSAEEFSANGLGNIVFGHDDDGVAMFDFEVTSQPEAAGRLLCGAEHHEGMYPGIIIRMQEIDRVRFGFRTVTFHGHGHLHDEPVMVTVKCYDGSGTTNPDHFWIKAMPDVESDDGGTHLGFHAEGDVAQGDIRIGEQN